MIVLARSRGDSEVQPAPDASSLSLGSMIRGPIGRGGADDRTSGSESADAERRAAEEPEA